MTAQALDIIVNGRLRTVPAGEITYARVARLAGHDPAAALTIVYRSRAGRSVLSGTLLPGESVPVQDGMVFNAVETA